MSRRSGNWCVQKGTNLGIQAVGEAYL